MFKLDGHMGTFVLLLMHGGWLVGFFNSTLHIQDKWNHFSLPYTDLFARKYLFAILHSIMVFP